MNTRTGSELRSLALAAASADASSGDHGLLDVPLQQAVVLVGAAGRAQNVTVIVSGHNPPRGKGGSVLGDDEALGKVGIRQAAEA
jgi:hypothetical protein